MPKSNSAGTGSVPKARFVVLAVFVVIAGVVGLGTLYAVQRGSSPVVCDTNPNLDVIDISVGTEQFEAEVAAERGDQVRGLSGRDCIDDTRAMLFSYALTGDYCYWMKDMKFAIDMVWLDDEKKLINYEPSVSPDTYPEAFCPELPAKYVVEFAAGTAERNDWQKGTKFNFELSSR